MRRLLVARDYAQRFGYAEAARYTSLRLRQQAEEAGLLRIRASRSAAVRRAPILPGFDASWPDRLSGLLQAAHRAPGGILPPGDLARAVDRLEALATARGSVRGDVATVVIPCYDQSAWVVACLESILTDPTGPPPRVVLVDDASPNADFQVLARVSGVEVLRNEVNLGYVHSVNRGGERVTTPVLVTVNQDVLVGPGWLEALLAGLHRLPSVGVVGPRILDSSFRLSEAGGLLFADGSAANRGRHHAADDVRFSYATDVDYVSGCCLATRTDLWSQLGGLDPRYVPAYYDDVDYCLRARAAGSRVRYLPGSVVVHAGGTSMGKQEDDTASLKHFQVMHQSVLAESHAVALMAYPDRPTNPATAPVLDRQVPCLLLPGVVPDPGRDGGGVDAMAIVTHLQRIGWEVSAACEAAPSRVRETELRVLGLRCTTVDSEPAAAWLARSPLIVSYGFEGGLSAMRLLGSARTARWLHFTGDVATRRLETLQSIGGFADPHVGRWYGGVPPTIEDTWRLELAVLESADLAVFVTQQDLDYVRARGFDGSWAVSSVMRFQEPVAVPPPVPAGRNVAFVGSMGHGPNVDGLRWFLACVWGDIVRREPLAELQVWGSGLDGSLTKEFSAHRNVHVRGRYVDSQEVYSQARVAVAPIRTGAGLKCKVLDAMLHGIPAVGTSIAYEGIDVDGGLRDLIVDDSEQFAAATVSLLRDDALWQQHSGDALSFAADRFTPQAEQARMADLVARLDLDPSTLGAVMR